MHWKIHLKIIATEFGPVGGPAASSPSWRGAKAAMPLPVLLATEIVVLFKPGGVFPGWSPCSTDLCGSKMANINAVIPVTRNCGMTTKML